MSIDIKESLELAQKLHPSTKMIFVINDSTISGRRVYDEFIRIIPQFRSMGARTAA
jgi:hypothetical protein